MEMSENLRIMRAIRDGLKPPKTIHTEFLEKDGTSIKNATSVIMPKLCEIGHQFGCKVGIEARKFGADCVEFLYDVTWRRYNGDHLIDVPLVGECEWSKSKNYDAVKYDFHKLLLARAGVRLMIYSYYALDGLDGGLIHGPGCQKQDDRKKAAREIAERLAGSVKAFKYRQEDDAWLLIGGVWHEDPWCLCFTIDQNGKVDDF